MHMILPHTLTAKETIDALQTNATTGLSSKEAQARLQQYRSNQLAATVHDSAIVLLFNLFKNSLIIILLCAPVLSGVLGHIIEAIAIGVIILFYVALGFIQELRASHALEALQKLAAPVALALRNGTETEILAHQLVPGDLIIIATGDHFPADARLVKSFNLKAEESALTGESLPVEKQSEFIGKSGDQPGDRLNMVFAGTSAIYGRGIAVVTTTGMQTEFGRIAGMLSKVIKEETPLEKNLDSLVRVLTRSAFVIVTLIILLGLLRGQPILEMIIFGIALAVAVVPEALPAVVTISLAIGVQRMIKRHALVRHLPAVETLGCTTIICSDKTGTLTKDEMTVRKIFVGETILEVTGTGYQPTGQFLLEGKVYPANNDVKLLLQVAILYSDARLIKEEGDGFKISGDPTEGALVVAAEKYGLKKELLDEQFARLAEIPFTSENKKMTTLCQTPEGKMVYSKGAMEIILQSCSFYMANEKARPLTAQRRESLLIAAQQFAEQALRV